MFLGAVDLGGLVGWIPRIFNTIWALFCTPIYSLISLFYNVFITIPQLNLLNNLKLEDIYQRVTMITVIVMAFYITFEIVKYVVQPDTITDKEKGTGKLVIRIIAVILLLAFIPKIFTIAYDLQGRIINSNVIGKVILGVNEESDAKLSSRGSEFSADVFSLFYHLNTEVCPLTEDGEIDASKLNIVGAKGKCEYGKAVVDMNLSVLRDGWTELPSPSPILQMKASQFLLTLGMEKYVHIGDENETGFVINFNGLIALIVGGFILWTLIVYGVELAKRYFQLLYLQIIAPIAIISYLSPKKDGTFSKWTKQCITTYLDLFIRLAIINFILLIISVLKDAIFDGANVAGALSGVNILTKTKVICWVYIFLIFGLFTFAKKAPKMLQELFPSSGAAAGNFGLSPKENIGAAFNSIKSIIGGTSRAIGGAVGAYTGAKTALNSETLKNSKNKNDRAWSAAKGAFMGAKAGFSKGGGIRKANAAALASVHGDEDIARSGGTVLGSQFQGSKYAQMAKAYERADSSLDATIKGKSNVGNAVKDTKVVGTAEGYNKSFAERNIGTADTRTKLEKQIQKATRVYSVSPRDAQARNTYETQITAAVNSVFDSEVTKAQDDYNIKVHQIQNNTELSDTERQQAITQTINERDLRLQQIENEKTEVTNTLIGKITEDETDNKHQAIRVEITEAQKSAQDAVYEYYDPQTKTTKTVKFAEIESIDETTGIPTINQNSVNSQKINNLNTFASDIGDIETAAANAKKVLGSMEKRKEAKANADASGKNGK